MTKKDIIALVNEIGSCISKEERSLLFVKEGTSGNNKKIGCNQFRDIASLCKSAECYEEIEMLIRYNMAKCKNGESWMFNCGNKKLFGEIVLGNMSKINNAEIKNDTEVLKSLELYFGYLYWQSRIWTAESEATNEKKG